MFELLWKMLRHACHRPSWDAGAWEMKRKEYVRQYLTLAPWGTRHDPIAEELIWDL